MSDSARDHYFRPDDEELDQRAEQIRQEINADIRKSFRVRDELYRQWREFDNDFAERDARIRQRR